MKKFKTIFNQVKALEGAETPELISLLWQLIYYSPKMPVRLQQQQLLNEAKAFTLEVDDPHFAKANLKFNGFIWGEGNRRILVTHGWGSKAADFAELITALKNLPDTQIIGFDAPGNGSSEGELSNLILFAKAATAIIKTHGVPDVLIGHSLGAMANALAIKDTGIEPELLISITPLINLKENFIATLNSADVSREVQAKFFADFEQLFEMQASDFIMDKVYPAGLINRHWLAFDPEDKVAPVGFLKSFLNLHPEIETRIYENLGHERIIKDETLIADIINLIS
ncbi:alpha/beta fold hydrolase [Mucilaginibacter celer]|uniref:Alpha/beta fold hydrolase n=1 Tax=Mucilaginibacter celer TaxID=2305508 RepID=A0A494VHH0_9SPHI|nr:alpha/beta hydrolase [Mucilaginibacter celer]AYL94157.1 alpha/beta fold hydrolase [Mucilaginibacter celer]